VLVAPLGREREVFAEEEIDDADTIDRVARKKLKSLARLDPQVQRRRLYAFLARRGYEVDDIARTVRAVIPRGSDSLEVSVE